jgi:trk system potassium uptake protein TrkA
MVGTTLQPTRRRVVVIGLGCFGASVAHALAELGHEVTAIDRDPRRVDELSEVVTLAVAGDGTDEELLRTRRVERSDVAIVAQGSAIEASLLAPVVLKRLGVPWVVARATNALHGEVLRRAGADCLIYPERDAGRRLAHPRSAPRVEDYLSLTLTSGVASFPAEANLVDRSFGEVQAACGTRVGFVAIKRAGQLVFAPGRDEPIQPGDALVVIGPDADIEAFVEAGWPPGQP